MGRDGRAAGVSGAVLAVALAAALALGGTGALAGTVAFAATDQGQGILPVGLSEEDATYTTVARLASADASLADTLVTFRGEAVGEPVSSSTDGSSWVLVQAGTSETSCIEVLMRDDDVAAIENFGSYQVKGSTLQVTGIYRVADAAQSGELDVTAYAVRVLDAGGPVEHEVDLRKLWVGGLLCAAGVGVWLLGTYLKRRSRL